MPLRMWGTRTRAWVFESVSFGVGRLWVVGKDGVDAQKQGLSYFVKMFSLQYLKLNTALKALMANVLTIQLTVRMDLNIIPEYSGSTI